MPLDLTIIIPTYNRAETLRQTLECMTALNFANLNVEFVIIDNHSTDHTPNVIDSFTARLPIRRLYEPRPGKNCALNRALADAPLAPLVVFTDDDVSAHPDWLQAIQRVSEQCPQYHVFGGKIYNILSEPVPFWDKIQLFLPYGHHEYADKQCPYQTGEYPFGGNFWVRREIFACQRRYDETLGPHPTNRINGSETSFLHQLAQDGYAMLYSPAAVVGHRIHKDIVTPQAFRHRAWQWGRGQAHFHGLSMPSFLQNHFLLKRFFLLGSFSKGFLAYIRAKFLLSQQQRTIRQLYAITHMAHCVELFRMTRK